ncbi:hypothetical protein FOS14_22750 [Skermania sp. ID1734]|uniref:DUF7373 family lipoprotein n=1 Tax=Skermania sp. ID1734 TaxID=2597516 RepID=UPI0011815183|nr:hypothetical protein [Skermania sp. ID1734]TSD93521.1 hypothetical protein FOS14_22750 [Skermania sp. ID1734]
MKTNSALLTVSALAAVTAVALSGCSKSDEGSARAASSGPATAKLDTGSYRTTPQPDFGKAGSPAMGAIIEGQRMAEFVIHPFDIDINLTKVGMMGTYVIKNSAALGAILAKPIPDSIRNDNFVTGFSTAAGEVGDVGHSTVHAVLRFADPASAAKAAQDLHQSILTTDLNDPTINPPTPTSPPNVGTEAQIPGLPDTLAVSHDYFGKYSVDALTVHGPYVLYDWFQGNDGSELAATKDWANKSVARSVKLQTPKIDAFPATDPAKLADLPIDVDGVLRLTLPTKLGQTSTSQQAVYGPSGFLHFSGSPVQDQLLLQQSGTDRIAIGASTVYRTRDDKGAQVLLDGFGKQFSKTMHVGPAPVGVPGAKCWVGNGNMSDSQTTCLLARGRFVAQINATDVQNKGTDLTQAQQMAAAQYEVLAGQK